MDDLEKKFKIAVLCFTPISIAVLLLPFAGEGREALGVIVGILFWAGVLAGSLNYFFLYKRYRGKVEMEEQTSKIPAGLRFFSNPAAVKVDCVLLVSLVGVIYCMMAFQADTVLDFISLFLFITSFYLHFMVNGKIFQYIAQKKKKGVQEE